MNQLEKLKAEQAKIEQKIAQEQHKLQRLRNHKQYYEKGERTKRAHRLITRGAAIESIAPEVKTMDEQSFYALMEGYKILLSHHPEYYEAYLKERSIDLILSGHAHGGQIRIFDHGLFAPGQGVWPRYTKGIHEGRFIVSAGLANTGGPIPRLFNPTELVIIDIENENPAV